jgi:hypothetical protein
MAIGWGWYPSPNQVTYGTIYAEPIYAIALF